MREKYHGLFGGSLMGFSKKSLLFLIVMLSAASGVAGKMADDVFVQICPRMFAVEIPGNMETSEWMSNTGWKWKQIKHYLPINKRAIHVGDFVYIYNPWVILKMENRAESGEHLQEVPEWGIKAEGPEIG